MPARSSVGPAGTPLKFNPKWLLLLTAAGVSLVAFDGIFPGGGVVIASGIALWWFLDTGAFAYITYWVKQLREGAASV